MEQIRKFYRAFREFFYDHPKFRITLEYLFTFIGSFLSAFIFAFGYKALVDPIIEGKEIGVIVTGGLSGISQIVVKIFEIFGFPVNQLSPFGDYWRPFIAINRRHAEAKRQHQSYSLPEVLDILHREK